MKFLALNVDQKGPSLNFLGLRKLHTMASKSGTPVKVVQIGMLMLPITTSTSDELFSRINIDDFERSRTSKVRGFN